MADPALIIDAKGLNTQPNELRVPAGSLSVAENVEVTRDGVVQVSPGFSNFSSNLPAFLPEQLFAVGGVLYAIIDGGWWYHDGSNWLRKRGVLGARTTSPEFSTVLNGVLFYTSAQNRIVCGINLTTGEHFIVAGRFNLAGSTDATGDAARFQAPEGICNDGTSLFVCDTVSSYTIRRIAPPLTAGAGIVTTIAGNPGSTGTTDGTGTAGTFTAPQAIVHLSGNLYVADSKIIRRVAAPLTAGAGVVTTIAGSAAAGAANTDGTGAAARFRSPSGICTDGTNLFVADTTAKTVRRVAPPLTVGAAVVTTIAGTDASTGTTDATGAAARFASPAGIDFDGTNLVLADGSNNSIRKLAPPLTTGAAVVTTLAGTSPTAGSVDGIGTSARFTNPVSVTYNSGNLYVCDGNNNTIRKIYPSTYVTTISGVSGGNATLPGSAVADGFVVGPT